MAKFTDIAVARDAEGVYDMVFDDTRDMASVQGFETALLCSLFSDRRADKDEVSDPMKRRGWIGNLVAETPMDNYGSGLWLYEQRRATEDVRALLRLEVISSLEWMREERLIKNLDANLFYDPAKRSVSIRVLTSDLLGGVSSKSFELWSATGRGQVATNQ